MAFRPGPAALPGRIALFPLPGALLLPRADLPLHIFEPRYLAMIEEVLGTPHRLIGMISPVGTGMADPQPDDAPLSSIGCAGRITRFAEIEDGRMMITLTGVCRFRLADEAASFTPWRQGLVAWQDFSCDLGSPESDPGMDRAALMPLVNRYLALRRLAVDAAALAQASDEEIVNALSMLCPFPPEDKQALLEAPDLSSRRETLIALFRFALRGGDAPDTVMQ